jgi:hypothetical protein
VDIRVDIELWKGKVPLKAIKGQLKIGERAHWRILALAKAHTAKSTYCEEQECWKTGLVASMPPGLKESLQGVATPPPAS